MPSILTLKQQIVDIGRRMYQRGMVAANDGNISARVDESRILITPTGISKGFMQPSDLVTIDFDGRVLEKGKTPTSELDLHLAVYRERPEINSVCHAHPPYGTAHAVVGIPLDTCFLSEMITALGSVPVVPYATPGTVELPAALRPFIRKYDAFLLQNHGVLTLGKDLTDSYHKMETLEHTAHINFISRLLGTPNILEDEQVEALLKQREKFGVQSKAVCKTSNPQKNINDLNSDEIEEIIRQIIKSLS